MQYFSANFRFFITLGLAMCAVCGYNVPMMKKFLRTVLALLCAAIFLVCAFLLVRYFVNERRADRLEDELSGLLVPLPTPAPSPTPAATAEPTPTSSPEPQVLEKYAQLYAENPDVIGWLYLEDSQIDNAVMWTPEEPDKYLHLDFYGNYAERGTLYLEEACDIWSSDNLLIYGHHMASGAMFGDLDEFRRESYWQTHKTIRFDTIYEERSYEIVAAFYARLMYANEEGFRYYHFFDAEDEEAFNEYVRFIEENQIYDTGVDIAYGDRLLTLSTCAYHTENGRFAVVARLIEDEG